MNRNSEQPASASIPIVGSLTILLLASAFAIPAAAFPQIHFLSMARLQPLLAHAHQRQPIHRIPPQSLVHQDKVITDLEVINVPAGGQPAAEQQFNRVKKQLESRGIDVGTYISGTSIEPLADAKHLSAGPRPTRANAGHSPLHRLLARPSRAQNHRRQRPETRHAFQSNIANSGKPYPHPSASWTTPAFIQESNARNPGKPIAPTSRKSGKSPNRRTRAPFSISRFM